MALREAKMAAFWTASPEHRVSEWDILGELPEHLRETLACLQGQNDGLTTADAAELLDQSIPNMNNRLRDLHLKYGLIDRHKEISRTGGYEWVNSIA